MYSSPGGTPQRPLNIPELQARKGAAEPVPIVALTAYDASFARVADEAGVDIVTIGQYLRPSPKHHAVLRFVEPAAFAEYELEASRMGFLYAASGPLVRSSYKAAEVFLRSLLDDSGADVSASIEARLARARAEAQRVAGAATAPTGLVPASSLVRGR